jgi:uncharacterized protein YjiS (DUF1127 family)
MTALAPIIVIFRAGVRKCSARLAAWQRQRQTYEAVMRCSDHLLTDMGIEREHVALIARGIDPRQHDASKSGWRGWWHGLRQQLDAARATRRERHRISRELMAYNDRNLDERASGARRSPHWRGGLRQRSHRSGRVLSRQPRYRCRRSSVPSRASRGLPSPSSRERHKDEDVAARETV